MRGAGCPMGHPGMHRAYGHPMGPPDTLWDQESVCGPHCYTWGQQASHGTHNQQERQHPWDPTLSMGPVGTPENPWVPLPTVGPAETHSTHRAGKHRQDPTAPLGAWGHLGGTHGCRHHPESTHRTPPPPIGPHHHPKSRSGIQPIEPSGAVGHRAARGGFWGEKRGFWGRPPPG